MSYLVRHSKFRHIFGEPMKQEFTGVNAHAGTPEGKGLAGSTKFIAVSWNTGGGGAVAVLPHDNPVRLSTAIPLIKGHTGPVLDVDFCPFDPCQLVTASEDQRLRVWQVPADGLTEDLNDPLAVLDGHQKKAHIATYHPAASNILASASHDHTVKLWDLAQTCPVTSMEVFEDTVFSVCWSYTGHQLLTASKDKKVRLLDPRSNQVATEWTAHDGTKPSKAVWLGKLDHVATVGFDRQSARQLKLYDPRNVGSPVATHDLGVGAGVYIPMYDQDINVLYLAAKGDTALSYFEFAEDSKGAMGIWPLNAFTGKKPQKGACLLPKLAGDIMKCEVSRIVRSSGDTLEILPMIVPRKATDFQEDIFPDTAAPVAALSAEEWLAGQNKEPITMKCKPGESQVMDATPRAPVKTAFQLQKELEEKDKIIAELQKEIETLKMQGK